MADAINLQILDAFTVKLKTISGIGTRVYDQYMDESEVEGKPAICLAATDEEVGGEPLTNTRKKLWDMEVEHVLYEAGGNVRDKLYELAKQFETVIEADPSLGIGNVEQARVVGKFVANVGSKDPQFGFKGAAVIKTLVRYRTTVGSP